MLKPDIHHNFWHPRLYTQTEKKQKLAANFNLTFIVTFQISKQQQTLKEQYTLRG